MVDKGERASFTREGVWGNESYKVTVEGPGVLKDEIDQLLSRRIPGSSLVMLPKRQLQKLLNDDAHKEQQVRELQQRGTELLEELRLYRRMALLDSQKEFVVAGLEALKERLAKVFGVDAEDDQE